jgi:hypothetical protein
MAALAGRGAERARDKLFYVKCGSSSPRRVLQWIASRRRLGYANQGEQPPLDSAPGLRKIDSCDVHVMALQ